jgi:hypothetical protein
MGSICASNCPATTVSPTSTATIVTRPAAVGPTFLRVTRFDGADAEHGRGNAALFYLGDCHIDRGQRAGSKATHANSNSNGTSTASNVQPRRLIVNGKVMCPLQSIQEDFEKPRRNR